MFVVLDSDSRNWNLVLSNLVSRLEKEHPMEYGSIPGIDKSVSRIVQGTVMLDEADPTASFALLDAAVEAGCTAFDTARHYGRGSEAVFGRWIRERGLRDRIMVLGKGAHHSAGAPPRDPGRYRSRHGRIAAPVRVRPYRSLPAAPRRSQRAGRPDRRGAGRAPPGRQDPRLRRLELVARAHRRGERLRRRARPRPVRRQQPELQPGRLGRSRPGRSASPSAGRMARPPAPGTPPRACR